MLEQVPVHQQSIGTLINIFESRVHQCPAVLMSIVVIDGVEPQIRGVRCGATDQKETVSKGDGHGLVDRMGKRICCEEMCFSVVKGL
jgi:hypothetical protein